MINTNRIKPNLCPHLVDGVCKGKKEDSQKYYMCEYCKTKNKD